MGKNRVIFYAVFAFYQIASFIFTVMMETGKFDLFFLAGHLYWFKYLTFIGVILISVDAIWAWRLTRKVKIDGEVTRKENNVLKAKIYDLQEARKEISSAASK